MSRSRVKKVMTLSYLAFLSMTLAASSVQGSGEVPVAHFEPQVAMLCHSKDDNYHSQYMTESGRWATDSTHKFTCPKEKMDILEYCKKVYPKHDITNIVESSHFVKVSNWCRIGHAKCKHTDWVKPFRCLEGPFQSDALLVPENCLFDHIHNQTKCWEFEKWNQTAAQACQDRDMSLRTFAMLLPCGISLFSGVEFVCCPAKVDKLPLKKAIVPALPMGGSEVFDNVDDTDTDDLDSGSDDDNDDDEDDDDDDDYDGYDDGTASSKAALASTTTTTTTEPPKSTTGLPTPDPYFTNFDPRAEHQAYKGAQQRLEELHREKVTKVMKDWSDLEERYQDMRSSDPKLAEEFKQRMTLRFQQTVQSLEEEGNAEKHQLVAMHQQRVMAHINQRKKEAMTCYTQALNDSPINTHRVQKCLQKLLRALHKDRHHTISHYRHLLTSSLEQAEREKSMTLEHLVDIDHMVNQSLQMLERFPELSSKISQLMSDYMQALRSKDDTPGSLLSMTREAEAAILDKYRADVTAMQEDKERERILEKERKEAHKRERVELREEARKNGGQKIDLESGDVEHSTEGVGVSSEPGSVNNSPVPVLSDHEPQSYAHAMTHDITHNEPTYSVRREVYHPETKSVYFTLAFAGIALMVAMLIGVTVLRRRNARSPQNQGFIEVDQAATPEEKHVANMQINGYENPTYKYFEVKENQPLCGRIVWNALSNVTVRVVATTSKILIRLLNKSTIHNISVFNKILDSRGTTPLVTVSNHFSCYDDPGMWSCLRWKDLNRKRMRWALAAREICFTNNLYAYFFILGKSLPVVRGEGVYQEAMEFCLEKLAEGEWVHVFPEGKVNESKEDLRLKWGVGRLIYESPIVPIVLPIYHIGMDQVLPNQYPYVFKTGNNVTFNFGNPIQLSSFVEKLKTNRVDDVSARKLITDKVQDELKKLREQTEKLHEQINI